MLTVAFGDVISNGIHRVVNFSISRAKLDRKGHTKIYYPVHLLFIRYAYNVCVD